MDLKDIALFREIVVSGSLSGAAKRLGTTPMAVSRRLAALEAEVGARLIHRTTRSLSLTLEGEDFLPHAVALLEAQDAALASLASGDGALTGTLRLSAPNLIGHSVIIPILTRLMVENPDLRVDVTLTDAVVDVAGAGLDLAVRVSPLAPSGLVATRLADNPRVLCAAPSYLRAFGSPANISALGSHACLILQGQDDWRFVIDGAVRGVRVSGPMTANSVDAIRSACIEGAGLALLTYWDVRRQIKEGTLARLELADAVPDQLGIWAVFPTRQHVPPRVRTLIEVLRGRLEEPLAM